MACAVLAVHATFDAEWKIFFIPGCRIFKVETKTKRLEPVNGFLFVGLGLRVRNRAFDHDVSVAIEVVEKDKAAVIL